MRNFWLGLTLSIIAVVVVMAVYGGRSGGDILFVALLVGLVAILLAGLYQLGRRFKRR